MIRTTITFPEELKRSATLLAGRRGISLAQLIREALADQLEKEQVGRSRDLLFEDKAVYRGAAPTDGVLQHDEYLLDHRG